MGTRSWKVGEVAAVTGLTVRTLHHYDELDLLHPAERTTVGNHRLYSETDMRRLYRIVALRGLGIPLPEIKRTLDLQGDDPRRALRVQLERLDHQVLLAGKLRQRVSRILVALEAGEQPSIDDLIEAIEEMTSMDSYYTPEQLARLEQRRQALGPDGIARVERDWARAIREMEAERQDRSGRSARTGHRRPLARADRAIHRRRRRDPRCSGPHVRGRGGREALPWDGDWGAGELRTQGDEFRALSCGSWPGSAPRRRCSASSSRFTPRAPAVMLSRRIQRRTAHR